MFTKIDKIDYV